jgi:hypothetical protein
VNNLDGQILFALIASLILAWVGSWWVARRYASQVLACMQMGSSPNDALTADIPDPAQTPATVSTTPGSLHLLKQNRAAKRNLRLALTLSCLVLAAIIAAVAQSAYVTDGFSWRRLVTLTLVFAWPLVATIGLLERWPRGKIFFISLQYVALSSVIVMLNSDENQHFLPVLLWLFSQQLPLLLIVFFMTGPKLRSTGPYLILVFFILTVSSLLGLSALEHSLGDNVDSWIIDLAQLTNAYVVFGLFSIAPWLLAFFPVRFFARRLANAYQGKAFSEPLYLAAGLWIITLLIQALTLSHSIDWRAYNLLWACLLFPIFILLMRPALRPRHQPPTLLLLRVFRGDNSIEALFDQVIEHWRYSGNTLLIAGKDLALRNLEPDELFGFLSGRLQERFITDSDRLQQILKELDLNSDPDGRYRINEFFCFDNTWKMVLETLVNKADRVLMDLRGYTTDRQGCSHELSVLADKPHLKKLIILFDKQTDKTSAECLLAGSRLKISWIDGEKRPAQTTDDLLTALLSDA